MSYIRYERPQRVGYSSHFDLKLGIDFDILACNWISFSCPKASTSVWVARQFQCKRYPSASSSYHHSTILPSCVSLPHNLPLSLSRQLPSQSPSLFPSVSLPPVQQEQRESAAGDKCKSSYWSHRNCTIFSFFQIHSIPVHDFFGLFTQPSPQLWNGPSLIDILFSISKFFTFTTKKMTPFTFKINIPKTLLLLPNCQTLKRTRNRPELPSNTLVLQLMWNN